MENAEKIELIKNKIIAFFSKKGVEEVNLSNKVMMLNGSLNFNNILKFDRHTNKRKRTILLLRVTLHPVCQIW